MTGGKFAIWLGVAIGLVAGGLLVVCTLRTAASNRYRYQLQLLMDEVIQLNEPIVDAFAAGRAPGADELQESGAGIEDIMDQLDNLGSPPQDLESAYVSVFEAATEFKRAFEILEDELTEGSGSPYSEAFLEAAHRGGEAVHRSASALQIQPNRGLCSILANAFVPSGSDR